MSDQPTANFVSALLLGIPLLLLTIAVFTAYFGFRTEFRAANVTLLIFVSKLDAQGKDISTIKDMVARTDSNVAIVRERSVRWGNPNE